MSPGRRPSVGKPAIRATARGAATAGKETLILDPAECKAALLGVIASIRASAAAAHLPGDRTT